MDGKTTDPRVTVVIPARGGSKGIPRKNLAPIGGHPLVGRAVIAAREASAVTAVVVSTDDPEISQVARRYGAIAIARPPDLSGDTATSESAVRHAAEVIHGEMSIPPEIVVLLQCTAPFTTAKDIDGTVDLVLRGGADSAFAAVPFHHFIWDEDAHGINHDGGPRARRQDLRPQYLEAGSVYAMRYASFLSAGHRFCGQTKLYQVDEDRVFEIDTPGDLRRAQALAPQLDRRAIESVLPDPVHAIVFDFDGVFTDNAVTVDQNGTESVRCDRSDGMGIEKLRRAAIPMLVLSRERNPVVQARCRKLNLPLMQGVDEKLPALKRWLEEQQADAQHTIYVGNDVNDLSCLSYVGCALGPVDSHPDILGVLHAVSAGHGGAGIVREIADAIVPQC